MITLTSLDSDRTKVYQISEEGRNVLIREFKRRKHMVEEGARVLRRQAMKNKKYIICSGLAFADQEDMEMLHQYALDGWIFKEFKGICYVLYKEEPQDLIFSYDMQKVKKKNKRIIYESLKKPGGK